MTVRVRRHRILAVAVLCAAPLLLAGCEFGAKITEQTGYRGAGLQQVSDPDTIVKAGAIPPPPYPLPPDEGPRAREVYQNVQVLGDMSAERFNHLMASITQWVSPEQGCNYCHNPANLADDSVYTKRVARQMLLMTQSVNTRWSSHVQQTGVTCWTCHRGNPVPENVWALPPRENNASIRGNRRGQNAPDRNVGYASLPTGGFANFFAGDPREVRVASSSAYPSPNWRAGTRDAEDSYGIMMHLSQSLGVNCTYCHNSQSFRSWSLSRGQRATAWYGIRMVRDINQAHITPLTPIFPANRLGPQGDPYRVSCLTCHQGQARPLGGISMLADYPYLRDFRPPQPVVQPAASEAGVPRALAEPGAMTDTAPQTPGR